MLSCMNEIGKNTHRKKNIHARNKAKARFLQSIGGTNLVNEDTSSPSKDNEEIREENNAT